MKCPAIVSVLCLAIIMTCSMGACASDWATSVVDSYNLGDPPYDNPLNTLGKPTTLVNDPGSASVNPGAFRCSLVYCAWQPFTVTDGTLITTIYGGGHLTVEFDEPIYDDPENWYGKDFIVFGNATFAGLGYVQWNTNMSTYTLKGGIEGSWEPMTVSVAQYENGPWYTYSAGPYADDFAPLQSFAWDAVARDWAQEMDFTRPVDPSLSKISFGGKTVARAIDLYKGSAGGTAFNLADLPNLPVLDRPGDPNHGRRWARYIRVSSDLLDAMKWPIEGEVDAFSRVSHRIDPVSIGEAKRLPDGAHVVLKPAVITAATYEIGPYCYIEHPDCSAGIKILGRVLARGNKAGVYGDMDTVSGERVVRVTALEMGADGAVSPVAMPIKSIGGGAMGAQRGIKDGSGLNNLGMLLRTCGRARSVDALAKSFTIDDGSGRLLKCAAPASADFSKLGTGKFVKVTGISSCELNAQQELIPVLRLRDQLDFETITQ